MVGHDALDSQLSRASLFVVTNRRWEEIMAGQTNTGMKKTLGLTGVTVNAMALIAPGAFLWMTFQLQAANVDSGGVSTAGDMWTGIVAALIVALALLLQSTRVQ